MPCPTDLYHGPASFLMSMPTPFQRLISAICVPELSPREMKGAPLALMVCSAKATFLAPLMLAGSSFGPMMTKSLYITEQRFTPNPSAMNFSSASLACTKTTSASPRRAMSSAWPVPRATTLTSMPVFCLNSGKMKPYSPESCVEVVEATTMDFSCAEASDTCARANAIANKVNLGRLSTEFLLRRVLIESVLHSRNHIRLYGGFNSEDFATRSKSIFLPGWPTRNIRLLSLCAAMSTHGTKRHFVATHEFGRYRRHSGHARSIANLWMRRD